jgi:trehalose/maltose transport system permease protein
VEQQARTIPAAIALFAGQVARQEPFGEVKAASVLVTIPLLVLVVIFQRRIIEGLTAGAVKEQKAGPGESRLRDTQTKEER